MKFQLAHSLLEKPVSDCIVVGVYEKQILTEAAQKLDKLTKNYLSNLIKTENFSGKVDQHLLLYHVPGLAALGRVLLVGCGKQTERTVQHYRKVVACAIKALESHRIANALLTLNELSLEQSAMTWKIQQAIDVTLSTLYQFHEFKSQKTPKSALQQVNFLVTHKAEQKACLAAIKTSLGIAAGVELTKNLANQPPNICNPTYLAKQAQALAKQYKSLRIKILEESDMKKLGMGAFLAVTQGSAQAAKLVCLEYQGTAKKQTPIAFVGKGITFDTGGLSLKPADGMVGMKYDMCGAATVLGTLKAAAELKLPLHLVGVLAIAENMPSGTATRPEDIVTSLSGQTIEIMNTDAEGRLVLCDALTYVERYKPETVIDIATLTGAVVIALGHHATGLLSNHQPLADELLQAGIESHDRAWQLPLWEEYQEQLRSPFADMSNVGGRAGGAITAACFLSRFTKKFHWAHLDVAGTAAMMAGTDRYATGRPVPLLIQFLLQRCRKK